MTLTEFLLARIAEEEAVAGAAAGASAWRGDGPDGPETYVTSADGERLFEIDLTAMATAAPTTLALAEHMIGWLPGRVLTECEAKRRIVTEAQDPGDDLFVRILATVYASHPDYREEYRP